jgi:glutamyl-tRNA synthetase
MNQNNNIENVVTRFAPSPTGFLHIGGARTALFNYLFAKRNNGKFLLRIEDTDKERSTQEAVDAIISGMEWLGLKHDGEIVFQSERAARHAEIAYELMEKGAAFKCYMTPDETEAERNKAFAEGRALRSIYRDNKEELDKPFVVRLRAPDPEEEIIIDDKVQGPVKTIAKNLDDMILLRTDGTPTYMLAVVVDDYDMGVTYIIRGDDHLINAARQSVIIDAMGWKRPVYAHIPLIHGEDGKKLSKRHGALAVNEYENMGYLPEALDSYLLRLGWSHGDLDIIDLEQATTIFDLNGLGKSPSRLDFTKLSVVNAHFIKLADDTRLLKLLLEYSKNQNIEIDEQKIPVIASAIKDLKERAKSIGELLEQTAFLRAKLPIEYNAKSKTLVEGEGKIVIALAIGLLNTLIQWDRTQISEIITKIATDRGVGLGKIGPVIRAALTGGLVAPDLSVTIELLGRDETLLRLKNAV